MNGPLNSGHFPTRCWDKKSITFSKVVILSTMGKCSPYELIIAVKLLEYDWYHVHKKVSSMHVDIDILPLMIIYYIDYLMANDLVPSEIAIGTGGTYIV